MTTAMLLLASMVGVSDWFAVGLKDRRLDLVARPVALIALLAAAASAGADPAKPWVVVALVCNLLAELARQHSDERRLDRMLAGAVAAHALAAAAFMVALVQHGLHVWPAALGLVTVGSGVPLWRRILRSGFDSRPLGVRVAVAGAVVIIGATVIMGFGTASILVAAGAVFVGVGLTTLLWTRVVQRLLRAPGIVLVTLQTGQFLLVCGLLA